MRRVSIARKLCVLRHDQLLSAWSLTKSLCPTSPCFPLASNVRYRNSLFGPRYFFCSAARLSRPSTPSLYCIQIA
jgi:hypothetical protein